MGYLLFVTLIQAFSFSLIGEYLAGHVDSYFAVLVRVVLAGLVFIPLTRWRQVEPGFMRGMLLIGALQFGITYVCLYLSFRVLTVPEVLLFTILTPLHVTLIEDAHLAAPARFDDCDFSGRQLAAFVNRMVWLDLDPDVTGNLVAAANVDFGSGDEPDDLDAAPDAVLPPVVAPPLPPTTRPAPGAQKYGEAVVRQVLGARFVREEPYQPPTRFS